MRILRVGLPAFVAALLLYIGFQVLLTAFRLSRPDDVISELRSAVAPFAIGLALLLATLAIARRIRAGYLLALVVSLLFMLAGLAFIVAEIPYLARGGMSAAFAGPFIVFGGIWVLAWMAYGWRLRAGRAAFATSWSGPDRWIGGAIAAVIVTGAGLYAGLGSSAAAVVEDRESTQAAAEALVHATTFAVHVVDETVSIGAGHGSIVEHLALELTITSPASYSLQGPPTLCLIDEATFVDTSFKPGTLCWGTAGDPVALDAAFGDPTIRSGSMTVSIELGRGFSICDFGAGPWIAQLSVAPRFDDSATGEPVSGLNPITVTADFRVEPASQAELDATPPPPCTGAEP